MIDRALAASLADAMIPGHDDVWPAASGVVDLDRLAAAFAALPPGAQAGLREASGPEALLAALATAEPAAVAALREAVYRDYYSAPAVQAAIRTIAESAPRDPSPHFDEMLLDAVKRRNTRPWRS